MSVQIEIVHKFDGAATALLAKLITALNDATFTSITQEPATVKSKGGSADTPSSPAAPSDDLAEPVFRVPGKPSPGAKRRTSAEVVEDKASAAGVKQSSEPAAPKPPTLEDTRARVRAFHKANGTPATKLLFDGLTGGCLQTLKKPDTEYATVMERLDAAGAPALGEPPAPKATEKMFD